jgi:hypothetical protein
MCVAANKLQKDVAKNPNKLLCCELKFVRLANGRGKKEREASDNLLQCSVSQTNFPKNTTNKNDRSKKRDRARGLPCQRFNFYRQLLV